MSEQTKPKPTQISVEVDTKRTEELARENERLRMKNQENEIEDKLAKAEADRIKFLDVKTQMAEKTGDPTFNEVKTKEEMQAKLDKLLKLGVQKANEHGDLSGFAPMNAAQLGIANQNSGDIGKMKFNEQTIRFLRKQAKDGDATAKAVLDDLMRKTLKDYGKTHENIGYSPDADIPRTNGTPEPPTETMIDNLNQSELRKFGVLKKRGGKWGQIPTEAQKAEMESY